MAIITHSRGPQQRELRLKDRQSTFTISCPGVKERDSLFVHSLSEIPIPSPNLLLLPPVSPNKTIQTIINLIKISVYAIILPIVLLSPCSPAPSSHSVSTTMLCGIITSALQLLHPNLLTVSRLLQTIKSSSSTLPNIIINSRPNPLHHYF